MKLSGRKYLYIMDLSRLKKVENKIGNPVSCYNCEKVINIGDKVLAISKHSCLDSAGRYKIRCSNCARKLLMI